LGKESVTLIQALFSGFIVADTNTLLQKRWKITKSYFRTVITLESFENVPKIWLLFRQLPTSTLLKRFGLIYQRPGADPGGIAPNSTDKEGGTASGSAFSYSINSPED